MSTIKLRCTNTNFVSNGFIVISSSFILDITGQLKK